AESLSGKEGGNRLGVRDVEPREPEVRRRGVATQIGEPIFLQGNGVIGIEVVDAMDAPAALEQGGAGMHADEPGGAGDEDVAAVGDGIGHLNPQVVNADFAGKAVWPYIPEPVRRP